MIDNKFDNIIKACFDEDMPYGDITTESVINDWYKSVYEPTYGTGTAQEA